MTAQLELGYMNRTGKGVPQDYFEATKWFRKPLSRGIQSARMLSAICTTAAKASDAIIKMQPTGFRKQHSRTMPPAQFNVGFLYQNGLGVRLNCAEAYYVVRVSCKQQT